MACERTGGCPMFKLFTTDFSLAVWRSMFCDGAFERCERLRIARSGGSAPARLLPNGRLLPEHGKPPAPVGAQDPGSR